jgi:PTS system nitrogen regulatory IIA component
MNLTNLFNEQLIFFVESEDKESTIKEIVLNLKKQKIIKKEDKIIKKIFEREQLGSTGIGKGIAIPHCKVKDIKKSIVAVGVSKQGIDFDSNDKNLTHLIVLVISPIDKPTQHLQILAAAAHLAKKVFPLIKKLMNLKTATEVYKYLRELEQENR